MSIEHDKFLTEAMGECWHNPITFNDGSTFNQWTACEYCKVDFAYLKFNHFSTWEGFGKLWEWAQKQEWWCVFADNIATDAYQFGKTRDCFDLIHPDRFADALYEYLTGR